MREKAKKEAVSECDTREIVLSERLKERAQVGRVFYVQREGGNEFCRQRRVQIC